MAFIKGRSEPAYSVVLKCGGVMNTASICSITAGAVSRWISTDGGDGIVPTKHWPLILAYAKKHKIKISLNDLSGIAP